MKQYEAYKDSGLDWLEEIPSHWDLQRTKRIVRLVTDNVSDHSLKKVALENIESWTGRFIETENEFAGDGVEFRQNDILFGKLRPYLAKVYKADFSGQSVGDIYVFRALDNNSSDFLKYLFISYPFISIVDGSTYGAKMPRANWDFISNLILPVPPLAEQEVIAAYLDQKVGKIDAILSEKEAMVEQLQQYRKSLISETVTRGLDPNVPMKDSGIDWIGQIPQHWDVRQIRRIANLVRGGSPRPIEKYITDSEDGYNWIKIGDAIKGSKFITSTKQKIIPEGLSSTRMVHVGDMILSNSMSFGQPYIMKIDGCIHDGWLALSDFKDIIQEYLYFVLQSTICSNQFAFLVDGGVVQNLNIDKVGITLIPVPTLKEQKKIVDYLNKKMSEIEVSISELQSQIEDLKAYKSSVITEAVTGKVDLRDWKPSEITA